MSTTLEKVQGIWAGAEGEDIARCIDLLETNPAQGIECFVTNNTLRKEMKRIKTTLSESMKKIVIGVYNRVTSKQFIELLPLILVDGAVLKQKALNNLKGRKSSEFIFQTCKDIDTAVKDALKLRATNTSLVYLSAANVERSEMIEDVGIMSYGSIIRNFIRFRPKSKESASNSLVFTANMVDLDNMVIDLASPLYFKVFPMGDVVLDDGYGRSELGTHDTTGLRFEMEIYDELFKLLKYNITPNILCKVAVSRISGFEAFVNDPATVDMKTEIKKQVRNYNKDIDAFDINEMWDDTGVIITQPGGSTFGEKLENLTPLERKQIMFQLIYTLYVFEKIEFSHGDLHTGNMFIVDVPETELIYIVDGVQFRFKTTKLLKIYDFDHSTICKSTNIKKNTDRTFTINHKLNMIRDLGEYYNEKLAETNIFNKNLDIVIFLNFLNDRFPTIYTSFTMFGARDPEFDQFFRDSFPGFDSANPVSQQKIGETYRTLIGGVDPGQLYEANRIFDIYIADETEVDHYGVSSKIQNAKWMGYFKFLDGQYGRIIKDYENRTENNHLWIPDTIIIKKLDMLHGNYFASLRSTLPIDVRYQMVYTIDRRVL